MKRLLLIIVGLAIIGATIFAVRPAMALPIFGGGGAQSAACSGIQGCNANNQDVHNIVNTVVLVLSWIVGVVAVIMLIIGGFRFIVSSGDQQATATARNTIIYALVGLAIAALAQLLVHFVLKKVNGL